MKEALRSMETTLTMGAHLRDQTNNEVIEAALAKVLKAIKMAPSTGETQIPEDVYERIFGVLWNQIGEDIKSTGGHGMSQTFEGGYKSLGSLLSMDGELFRIFSNMVISVGADRRRAREKKHFVVGWEMQIRPMTSLEIATLKHDKYDSVYRVVAGDKVAERDNIVLEVQIPNDFDDMELVMFLDGVFRNIDNPDIRRGF
jgi:hypothetical protein